MIVDRRISMVVMAAALLAPLLPAQAVAQPGPIARDDTGENQFACDFNGDGNPDWAIGAPGEDLPVGGRKVADVGVVDVAYGYLDPDVFRSPGQTLGVGADAERGDRFGATVVCADFDGRGVTDLAVGIPGRNGGAGEVRVYYGHDAGGSPVPTLGLPCPDPSVWPDDRGAACPAVTVQTFSLDTPGVPGSPAGGPLFGTPGTDDFGDQFGYDLTWGNFDFDSFYDLAISIPGRNIGSTRDAGAVLIVHGSPTGLDPSRVTEIRSLRAQTRSYFGRSLAAGDLVGDSAADLVVASPYAEVRRGRQRDAQAGKVEVFAGSVALSVGTSSPVVLTQNVAGFGGGAETGNLFGASLAVGYFVGERPRNDDDRATLKADLAISAPLADARRGRIDVPDQGEVFVVAGSPGGLQLSAVRTLRVRPDRDGRIGETVAGSTVDGDLFGLTLQRCDCNGDGYDDLVVGVPGEDVGRIFDAGVVRVYLGGSTTSAIRGVPPIHLGSISPEGVEVRRNHHDEFGSTLAEQAPSLRACFENAGTPEDDCPPRSDRLLLGIPRYDVDGRRDAGAVLVVQTQPGPGPLIARSWLWTQRLMGGGPVGSLPAAQGVEAGDRWGSVSQAPAVLED